MNIFVLDYDTRKCAEYHVNKHVVKMITESAQLLSTAVRVSGIDAGYKITHLNHPCSIWCRESLSNWRWLKQLTDSLCEEYCFRYDRFSHKAHDMATSLPEPKIPDLGLTKFALAMPEQYQTDCAIESYRNYYRFDKYHLHEWGKREKPDWL